MSAPVFVVPYDPAWPAQFAAEKKRLQDAIGAWITSIEHVGSTAVPGLAAKPVIDLLVGIRRLEDAPHTIAPLKALGYDYIPEYEDTLPMRRYFQRLEGGQHTHHIHMVEPGTDFWNDHLLFRDYLIRHPEAVQAYGELKLRLAEQFRQQREAYSEAKSPLIAELMARARAEANRTN